MAEFSIFNGYTVKDATARNIAKGRNQAVAYNDYASMIEVLNAMEKDEFRIGQNIYIGTVGVPDLWVYTVENVQHTFDYVSDDETVELLKNNTTIQVGYYKLAMLEGQKVDLTTVNAELAEHDTKIAEHDTKISSLSSELESFQNGVDSIASTCATYGSTPSANTPNAINASIKNIYNNRYTAGQNSVKDIFSTAIPAGKYLKMSNNAVSSIASLSSNKVTFVSSKDMVIVNVTGKGYTKVAISNNLSSGAYIRLVTKTGTTSTGSSTLKSSTLYENTAFVIISGALSNTTEYTATFS